ncbi:hypothetical protein HY346_00450 [Candidatus Microgenomates bacterium]|nr:hypothetical protein [Candidatus Microgenomates bacterium]
MHKVLTAIAAAVTVLFIGILAPFWYGVWKDTDSLIDRAQVAAEAEDMLGYLRELKGNLEEHDMTEGYTAVIFKGPSKDLALNYLAVVRLIERLEGIVPLDKADTAYQVALDDIRGTLRELPNPASGYVWVRSFWWMWGLIALWVITVISWVRNDYY